MKSQKKIITSIGKYHDADHHLAETWPYCEDKYPIMECSNIDFTIGLLHVCLTLVFHHWEVDFLECFLFIEDEASASSMLP